MCSLCACAARADEGGKLLLHFLQLPVGEKTYSITAQPDGSLLLRANFDYTERGSHLQLAATLRMKPDFTPLAFEAKGKSYRPFSVNAAVTVNADGRSATVREGEKTRQSLPARVFTIEGYAPFSIQMMMLRYWASHGKPARLAQFPAEIAGTEAEIELTGNETIEAGGRTVHLTRYSIGNVVWGRETIWLDNNGQIAGGVSYAGGLPLEAVREEYRAAFPQFIRSANADRMREAAALAARIRPLAAADFAIVGATLIDGTGAAPIPDSVVIVRGGKIATAGPRSRVTVPAGMRTIDARGSSVLPGLWEMHAHFAQVEWGPAYLGAGVTSARDCGGEFEFITAERDAIERGSALGPSLLLAGSVDRSGTGPRKVRRQRTSGKAFDVAKEMRRHPASARISFEIHF